MNGGAKAGRALVVGAGGAVGESAALALCAAGWRVTATMRRAHAEAEGRLRAAGADVARFDLERDAFADVARGADAVVLTPILSLTVGLASLLGGRRVIAFSSNNVAIDPQAPTYRKLAAAEAALHAAAPQAVILRPTLIYGDARLETLPRVMRLARRAPVLPVPGSGQALQQPVFYGDLGAACAALAASDAHAGATFALGGPDVVRMRDLFALAAEAMGATPLIAPTPRWALSLGARVLGARFPLDAAQIARADADRLAVTQTPLPDALAPRTTLRDGLAALAKQLREPPPREGRGQGAG